ncbi:MAG: VOC family protein [Spirochaetales bacterium]|nr:VOC family protein [Spirochaetales bacterium]
MTVVPYLNMSGNAEEAMNFYKDIFGGTVEVMRWKDMPPNPKMPVEDDWKEKIMHATLTVRENMRIFLADSWVEEPLPPRSNVYLHVEFDSEEELRRAFEALAEGGKINMPLDKTFWGAFYGDLVDKFGVGWGMHYQLPD